ncbi:MAG: hypothetical protein ABW321_10125 [Polyangiales bacterium]
MLWERGNPFNPLCFARSARVILLDAPTLFANLPRGPVTRALGFSAWVAVALTASTLLSDATQLSFDWSDARTQRVVSLYGISQLARQACQTLGLVLLSALGFHMITRCLGGRGSAVLAVRAAAYGSAFLLFNVLTTFAITLAPPLELAALIVSALTQSYLYFSCLCAAAVEHYGVSRARAELAAGATVGMLVPAMFASTLLATLMSHRMERATAWLWQ